MAPRTASSVVEVRPHLWQSEPDGSALEATQVEFRVLASSSGGNCSVLALGSGRNRRAVLIDAGLSPRRTNAALHRIGLSIERIDSVLFTHLDHDHCRPTWARALPDHAQFVIARRHRGRAERMGLLGRRTTIFEDEAFELRNWARVRPVMLSHDSLGVAAFRLDFAGGTLGYATDVGRAAPSMLETMRGVDWLAIESNYCPRMQRASGRPAFLIDRIMGGAGHLSNEESCEIVRAVGPRRGCVLLHLSRQCNTPERARDSHAHPGIRVVVSHHTEPTPGIPIASA